MENKTMIDMNIIVYTYVKKFPFFNLNVGARIFRINGFTYMSQNSYSCDLVQMNELENIDFDDFVNCKYFEKETKIEKLPVYKQGDFIVIVDNKSNSKDKSVQKNNIYSVVSNKRIKYKYIDNLSYTIKVRNVNTGKEEEVSSDKILGKTRQYWFLNSHGTVSSTYFLFNTDNDAYRILTNNVFYSYEEANNALEKINMKIDDKTKIISNAINKNIL